MARGKKTDNETIYKIMISMFSTNNFSETARQLNLPITTVEKIYKENKEKEEFVKLCNEKKDEFVQDATRIINKATSLLEKRIDTALESQDELEDMIQEIWDAGEDEIKGAKKKAMINKLSRLQLNSLNEITTALGTLFDKRNLAEGKSTVNTDINIRMDKKVEELSQ